MPRGLFQKNLDLTGDQDPLRRRARNGTGLVVGDILVVDGVLGALGIRSGDDGWSAKACPDSHEPRCLTFDQTPDRSTHEQRGMPTPLCGDHRTGPVARNGNGIPFRGITWPPQPLFPRRGCLFNSNTWWTA